MVSEGPREDVLGGARMSQAHCPDHLAGSIFEPEVRGIARPNGRQNFSTRCNCVASHMGRRI